MRNRLNTAAWALLGLGVGVLGCASDERTFGGSATVDGGEGEGADASSAPADQNDAGMTTNGLPADTLVVIHGDASINPSNMSPDASQNDLPDASGMGDTGATSEPSCTPTLEVEGNCTDHVDDDCDGLYDCDDLDDCGTSLDCLSGCVPSGDTETTCDDVADDDCDGFLDCDDVDCVSAENCETDCEPEAEVCADSDDNDCDGFIDCLDSACASGPACCEPSGAEICDDGVDNNCDGAIDCPILTSAVPTLPAPGREDWEGGAVAANQVTLHLQVPSADQYTVQCRSGKPGDVNAKQFVVCNPMDPSSTDVKPLREVDATNPAYNGLVTTQLRFSYPNGQASQPISYTYYVHNSLAGAEPCEDRTTDQAYFEFAAGYLDSKAGAFADAEARLAAPFVNIGFEPSPSSVFEIEEGQGSVEYLSLRRRFVLSADKELILMKRAYRSRRAPKSDCLATTIRKHLNDIDNEYQHNRYHRTGCHAVVMNKNGAGLCLVVDENDAITISNPTSGALNYWALTNGWLASWTNADNFLWRKLLRTQADNTYETFSPKCYAGGSSCTGADPNVLFLPDRGLFEL